MWNLIVKATVLVLVSLLEQNQDWLRFRVMLESTVGTVRTEQATLQILKQNWLLCLVLQLQAIYENTIVSKFKTWFMGQ